MHNLNRARNIGDLSDKQIEEICKLVNEKVKYDDIVKKYKKLSNKSQITAIKKKYIEKIEPKRRGRKNLSEREKNKLSKQKQRGHIAKKSEIIIDGYINVLKGFESNIKNLEEIQKVHADKLPELVKGLNELNEGLRKLYHISPERVEETLFKADRALKRATNIFLHTDRRIRAIAELRRQLETFVKLRIDVEVLKEIGKMFEALIMACEVLSDGDYFRFKEAALSGHEGVIGWFERYEGKPMLDQHVVSNKENKLTEN